MSYTDFDRIADLDYERDHGPCRHCHGSGWRPSTYSSGPSPCGCDEPDEDASEAAQ